MKVGDTVRIDKCDTCPKIVGKTVRIKGFCDDRVTVLLNFGRGRPSANRPEAVKMTDVSLVKE